MTRNEQQMAVGTVVCLAPGWDVVRQPAADDRLGRVAIEAMDVVEFLKLSNADYRGINDPDVDARWRAARATSNTDDAEALIANICAAIGKAAD